MCAMRVLTFVIGTGLATAGVIRADDTPRVGGTLEEGVRQLRGKWEYAGKDSVGIPRWSAAR
jgi:hypothetical protein